jgi:hypothetical protein
MIRKVSLAFLVMVIGVMVAAGVAAQEREGIKVHGHWTIDIRNPDGTLVSHREFENALVIGQGDLQLASVLSRNGQMGTWGVILTNPAGAGPCPTDCVILEPAEAQAIQVLALTGSANLQVQQARTSFSLTGSMTATTKGSITQVSTLVAVCSAFQSCGLFAGAGATFSQAMLSQPVPIVAGQIIQVTVTFSFS